MKISYDGIKILMKISYDGIKILKTKLAVKQKFLHFLAKVAFFTFLREIWVLFKAISYTKTLQVSRKLAGFTEAQLS